MSSATEVDRDMLLDEVERLVALDQKVEGLLIEAVGRCRRSGLSWYAIAPALGVSRQAASMRFAPKVDV
jgi:hypothetical protein